ncbi:hypothetical protein FN846DRAFT_906283 [Sphaerosporella brunnea]|uniref:Uncharacterized protein n=1 Tax=Sphaerosporella brunnea TaxID=1250544 RepID=A0A5J5EZE6_9PEZI|nr:hypothetical protein FN846DRAFT_906283 [Sphaerosporella brunnea]
MSLYESFPPPPSDSDMSDHTAEAVYSTSPSGSDMSDHTAEAVYSTSPTESEHQELHELPGDIPDARVGRGGGEAQAGPANYRAAPEPAAAAFPTREQIELMHLRNMLEQSIVHLQILEDVNQDLRQQYGRLQEALAEMNRDRPRGFVPAATYNWAQRAYGDYVLEVEHRFRVNAEWAETEFGRLQAVIRRLRAERNESRAMLAAILRIARANRR